MHGPPPDGGGTPMRVVSKPAAPVLIGFLVLCGYTAASLCTHFPFWEHVDGRIYCHWEAQGFAYASSPFDLSAMSPVHGLGGLVTPVGVWLHPAYLPMHMVHQHQPLG